MSQVKAVEIEFDGVRALYAKHEIDAMRGLITLSDTGAISRSSAIEQVRLLHGLKTMLGASIVDAHEEAQIRRDWEAAEA